MNAIIETENLRQNFGHGFVVRDLNLRLMEGSIYALLGSNGAGKTTALKTLLNMIEPAGGSSRIMGKDSRKLKPGDWQKIGYVSENQQLHEWMTLRQLFDYCRPLYPAWDEVLCEKLRKNFDLPLNRRIREFSRGMKVKAALLSVLSYRPRLLVLDEPFTGLDALVRDDLIQGILELSEDENLSVLISSHDIDEIEKLVDQVGFLKHGELLLQESIESLQSRFQQVDVVLEKPTGKSPLDFPDQWLEPEVSGARVRFVAGNFSNPEETRTAVKALLPEMADVTFTSLSLRSIFLTLARATQKKTFPKL